jgi:bacterioferritin
MFDKPHLTDVQTFRTRIREHIEKGVLTVGYRADCDTVLKLLNDALASATISVWRYQRYQPFAHGIYADQIAGQFVSRANEIQSHVDRIAKRIIELGGEPNFAADGTASRSSTNFAAGKSLVDLVKDDMIALCITIDSYKHILDYLNDRDPTTYAVMSTILAAEEKYASALAALLEAMPP